MLETVLQPLIEWVTATIGGYGLSAVFILMLLESTGFLIPSEAISPFAGYLATEGGMTLFGAVAAGVLGNVVGSWVAYFIGLWGGRELWIRYGRYVGVRKHHLKVAERWFERRGELAVFVSRCLPVVCTFISFPAGTTRMNFARFTAYTFPLRSTGLHVDVLRLRPRGELGQGRVLPALPGLRGRGGPDRERQRTNR